MKPAGNGVTPATAVPTLITGVTGLITVVLIFGGQALIQAGGGEPAFDVPASEVATFFANRQPTLFAIGSAMNVLAAVVFVWFLGGLRLLLKNDWRATVAMVSGALGLAPVLTGGWELAVFRLPQGVNLETSRLAFDMGNLSFASGWVAMGGFAVASGWAALSTRALPRGFGWWAVGAGICLIAARFAWTTPLWLLGYALLWMWVVAVCVRLVRRRARVTPPSSAALTGLSIPGATT